VLLVLLQFGERLGQIIGMHHLVRRLLAALLPAVRRARRRRDKEELTGVGQRQVCVGARRGAHGCGLSEVDAAAVAQDRGAVPLGTHADRGVFVLEGDDDAGEGFQRREGVDLDGGILAELVAEFLQIVRLEDLGVHEVRKNKGIRGRGRLRDWEVAQVEREG